MQNTAIFGGTFNPFHIGHYEMLKALQKDSNIDEIFLMPDRNPPHKLCDFLAEDKDRIEMCRLVTEDFGKARLCLIEFEREGKSYSYDTVLELKKRYPQKKFSFVCGGDMLVIFEKWYKYEELMREVPFIVFKRTDTDSLLFDEAADRLRKKGMKITVMNEVISTVSSTEIRNDFKKAKQLLPKAVFDYLIQRGVYNEQ